MIGWDGRRLWLGAHMACIWIALKACLDRSFINDGPTCRLGLVQRAARWITEAQGAILLSSLPSPNASLCRHVFPSSGSESTKSAVGLM